MLCWGHNFSTNLRGLSMRTFLPTTLTRQCLKSMGLLTYSDSLVKALTQHHAVVVSLCWIRWPRKQGRTAKDYPHKKKIHGNVLQNVNFNYASRLVCYEHWLYNPVVTGRCALWSGKSIILGFTSTTIWVIIKVVHWRDFIHTSAVIHCAYWADYFMSLACVERKVGLHRFSASGLLIIHASSAVGKTCKHW